MLDIYQTYVSEVVKMCKCKFYPSFISKENYTYDIIVPVCLLIRCGLTDEISRNLAYKPYKSMHATQLA
jgi:hypothetical protein